MQLTLCLVHLPVTHYHFHIFGVRPLDVSFDILPILILLRSDPSLLHKHLPRLFPDALIHSLPFFLVFSFQRVQAFIASKVLRLILYVFLELHSFIIVFGFVAILRVDIEETEGVSKESRLHYLVNFSVIIKARGMVNFQEPGLQLLVYQDVEPINELLKQNLP